MNKIVTISGPSGAGKSTIINRLVELYPDMYCRFLSYTTREKRDNEVCGVHYHFICNNEFKDKLKECEIFEFSCRHGCPEEGPFWGMGHTPMNKVRSKGLIPINDVETQGVKALKKMYGDAHIAIFLNLHKEELERRLRDRGGAIAENARRIKDYDDYFTEMDLFDSVVYNDEVEKAVQEIHELVLKR